MKNALLIAVFFLFQTLTAVEEVVILGSGPAGLTAAIYTSRSGLSTTVVEGSEPGGQIAYSHAVDNFPGFPKGINGFELIQNMRDQAERFGTRIKEGYVEQIDLTQRPFRLYFENGEVLETEALIIASGASAKWLGLASENVFIGRGVSSCAVCDGLFFKGKDVVVVGGGDTALEDALFLANYVQHVTVVHRRDALRASKYLQEKAFHHPKIKFIWNHVVEEINDPDLGVLTGITIRNILTDEKQTIPCQGVFVAIGHQPNTSLFKDQIELDGMGYIITKPFTTMTNIPGVFAAGDVADPHYRQAITAAGTGCMAAINAYHYIQQHEKNNKPQMHTDERR